MSIINFIYKSIFNYVMRSTAIKISAWILVAMLPVAVFATGPLTIGTQADAGDVFAFVGTILNLLASLFVSLAVVYFLWGLAKFVLNSGDEEARKEARSMIVHSIVAIAIMVSVWALVGILIRTVGGRGTTGSAPDLPINNRTR
ncbi:MAG: hypothetical protein A2408_01215 [Candidatus Yonathbacteria bacterium RIFOXYC1_FULL_52_10]|uniref:Uncharacterized protein n=1 Tax=Candidatus Yonathbacteria bacterium RIFOXYD1_FULL_52_36 TaxID=1802730 RepID=A0A1G2SKN9_9BACT|nr:MAG: hypothetical protein A2408_01215 [Candidatus Yonathbacteria bacterium RIFOXYC1_FULL_52_10]OHA85584.1 MAG: hypothetical protein A2591_00270 [Candidatus Yonathbacteria bacterium RIFOXYD1_FULL_52_36]